MALYYRVADNVLYLGGTSASGTLYSGGYITNSSSLNQSITSVVVESNCSYDGSCMNMFLNCQSLTEIDLSKFDASMVTSMKDMFNGCYKLTSLTLSSNFGANCTDMSGMFSGCFVMSSFENVISKLKTSKVTDMSNMFCNCYSQVSFDISSLDTSNVANISGMFEIYSWYASNGKTTTIKANINTNKVVKASGFISYQYVLNYIDISGMNLANSDVGGNKCLISVWGDTSTLPTRNATLIANNMKLPLNCKLSNIIPLGSGEQSLIKLEMKNFDSAGYTSLSQFFLQNQASTFNFSFTDTSKVTDMSKMFYNNTYASIDIPNSNIDTSSCTNMSNMFGQCKIGTSLDVSSFDTSKVTDMSYMFYTAYTSNVTSIVGLSNFDTSKVTNMSRMFYVPKVTSLDVSSFDTSKVTDMSYMFAGCNSLTSLTLTNFDTSVVANMSGMFNNCSSLKTIAISSFRTGNATKMSKMFSGCTLLTTLDLSKFDTSKVTDMSWMFYKCTTLTALDLSSFITNSVINFSDGAYSSGGSSGGMFSGCTKLASLKIDEFIKGSSAYAYEMFYGCTSLKTIDCKNTFDSTNTTAMFTNCTYLQGETAKGGIAYSSSKTTGAYAKISGGYFTYPKRTLTTSISGNGTITSGGTYDKGTEVKITIIPTQSSYAYLHSVVRNDGINSAELLNADTLSSTTYTEILDNNTSYVAKCLTRTTHKLTATSPSGYEISGAGTYYYLDKPTLIISLGGGLISLEGWYLNDSKVSNDNPYTFIMPDKDVSLIAKTSDNPFSNEKIRQIILQNSFGQVFKLTDKNSKVFWDSPSGLGYGASYDTYSVGNTEKVITKTYEKPQPSGKLIFVDNTNDGRYGDYYKLVRFLSKTPITLWYKIPITDESIADDVIYHLPVEITELTKSESDKGNYMECSIKFKSTGFFKLSDITANATANYIEVYNDSDFDIGAKITLRRANYQTFSNPVIKFIKDGVEYGACAITYENLVSVTLNTDDINQSLVLLLDENTGSVVERPFGCIDFSYADGVKDFPFPKLKQGRARIEFTYDNKVSSENSIYIVQYDKEYLSV